MPSDFSLEFFSLLRLCCALPCFCLFVLSTRPSLPATSVTTRRHNLPPYPHPFMPPPLGNAVPLLLLHAFASFALRFFPRVRLPCQHVFMPLPLHCPPARGFIACLRPLDGECDSYMT